MRNTVYLCVILCFILHSVKSKTPEPTRSGLKPNSKKPDLPGEKFDISKFVHVLLRDAKKIAQKRKKSGQLLRRTTEKTKTKSKTADDGFASSYDDLGLDENMKARIIRSNNPKIDLEKLGQMFPSNNLKLNYKKFGQTFRSNAGPDDNKTERGILRTLDRSSDEEGGLLFDLESGDELKNPLF